MITEEKIKKARKQLRSGVPEGEIKNELISEGHTEEDLAKVFKPHRPDMRSWYVSFAVIFLLLGLYRLVAAGSFLFLGFASAMFIAYAAESTRIKKAA